MDKDPNCKSLVTQIQSQDPHKCGGKTDVIELPPAAGLQVCTKAQACTFRHAHTLTIIIIIIKYKKLIRNRNNGEGKSLKRQKKKNPTVSMK